MSVPKDIFLSLLPVYMYVADDDMKAYDAGVKTAVNFITLLAEEDKTDLAGELRDSWLGRARGVTDIEWIEEVNKCLFGGKVQIKQNMLSDSEQSRTNYYRSGFDLAYQLSLEMFLYICGISVNYEIGLKIFKLEIQMLLMRLKNYRD